MIPIAAPEIGEVERERIEAVLESGHLADGPEVRSFEAEFADYCDVNHAIGTSNGTTALHAAFEAIGIGAGDRVLTTPFSFVASANAIRFVGAEPVFADIDRETYNLDPAAVEATIEACDGAIDALLVVHLYGLPADMQGLLSIADDYDLAVVEDAAQAHGAAVNGKQVGSLGDVACFSFYPTKNMTTGEGGMITTDDEAIAERAARFINHGRDDTYEHAELGHNFRMTSVAAAMGRGQLERLPEHTAARRRNAARLTEGLAEIPVNTPIEPEGRRHVYHQYTIRTTDRSGLRAHLDEHEVGYGVYYPNCIHTQPAYSHVSADAPVAERATEEVLSLPVHPALDAGDIETIVDTVTTYVE